MSARTRHGTTRTRAKKDRPADGMNGLERAFYLHQMARIGRGEIRDYRPHALRLLVVPAVPASDGVKPVVAGWYEPDGVEIGNDWSWAICEVKGWHEADPEGWLKFKLAASLYPFPAFYVQAARQHTKDKVLVVDEWEITRYGHAREAAP